MHWFATDKRTALVDEPMQAPAPPLVKSDPHEGFRRYPYCCGGVLDDFRRRARHCGDDYATAVRHWSKTLSSALFMFFATVFSTVALGVVIQKNSSNRIGLAEYLFMNSLAGMAHAVLGGQPLLVLRQTGYPLPNAQDWRGHNPDDDTSDNFSILDELDGDHQPPTADLGHTGMISHRRLEFGQ